MVVLREALMMIAAGLIGTCSNCAGVPLMCMGSFCISVEYLGAGPRLDTSGLSAER